MRWRIVVTTPERCRLILVTEISNTRCGILSFHRRDSKISGGNEQYERTRSKVSPAAHEAMRELVELFSDPNLASKARFRCGIEGRMNLMFCSSQSSMSSSAMIYRVNITSISPRPDSKNSQRVGIVRGAGGPKQVRLQASVDMNTRAMLMPRGGVPGQHTRITLEKSLSVSRSSTPQAV